MPSFRESYSSLQDEEQPDTSIEVLGCSSPWWSELQGSRNVGIPRMDLDTKEIRETHNLYIEKTRGSLKNIINFIILFFYFLLFYSFSIILLFLLFFIILFIIWVF